MLRFANQYLNPALAFAFVMFAASGYVLSAILPTTIVIWNILLIASLLISGGTVFFFGQAHAPEKSLSTLQTLVSLLPYLIFLPGIWLLLTSPALQISYHGDLHSGYINQILYGIGQPENTYLAGTNATYYWLYHALIASLSNLSHIPHPLCNTILSIVVLISILGWVHRSIGLVLAHEYPPIVTSMLVIFVLFGLNLLGSIQSMVGMWDNFSIWRFWEIIAPVSLTEFRLTSLYEKFMTYNSFPLTLVYCWISIYAAIKIVKQEASAFDISLFLIGIGGGTAFLLIGGALMSVVLVFSIVATALFLRFRKTLTIKYSVTWLRAISSREWIPVAISLVCLIPLMVYAYLTLTNIAHVSGTGHSVGSLSLQSLDNAFAIFGAFYALTLFLFIGAYLAWRENDAVLLFLIFAMLSMLYGGLTIASSEYYKLIILAGAFATLIVARVLNRLSISLDTQETPVRIAVPVIIALYFLCALNIISYAGGTLPLDRARWAESFRYIYNNGVIESEAEPYQDVYTWIRTEVDFETVIVMQPNATVFTTILSYHLPFVADTYYAKAMATVPEWDMRTSSVYRIMHDPIDTAAWQSAWDELQILLGDQSVVYVFPNDLAASPDDLEAFGFERLFEGSYASVYRFES